MTLSVQLLQDEMSDWMGKLSGQRDGGQENKDTRIVWNFLGHMNSLVQLSFWNLGEHGKPDMGSLRGRQSHG